MKISKTRLKGCFILEPKIYKDNRGYFMESYNKEQFNLAAGYDVNFIQDNQSLSYKGVIRGLHFQTGDFTQAKLVRVLSGKVLDIAVDIRTDSPTFGQYESIEISAENGKQFFIPKGFAHGFSVLSETALFFYKCDNFYHRESERGILYCDKSLNIDWQVPANEQIISEKDLSLPPLTELLTV